MTAVMRPEVPIADAAFPSVGQQMLLGTWFSPAFPVGGFAYSHGLETAIASGAVLAPASLAAWIGDLAERGSLWCDAVFFAEAWRAVTAGEAARLDEVAELAEAMAPSRERSLETLSLGVAFLAAIAAGWPTAALASLGGRIAYPVAAGATVAAHAIPLAPALAAFLNGTVTSLASVAVRLVPLGQSDGLRVLAGLQPRLLAVAAGAAQSSLDDLGSATLASDIASMRHETLEPRLFRS
jgi:urease accessory protein